MKKLLYPYFVFVITLAIIAGCSSGSVAGGGSDHPNCLVGYAQLPDGSKDIAGASVVLVCGSYASDSTESAGPVNPSRIIDTVSCDATGRFIFSNVDTGTYYCYVIDSSQSFIGRSVAMTTGIADTVVAADTVFLDPAAYLAGASLSCAEPSCRLYLAGTPFGTVVTGSSWMIGPVPAGTYRMMAALISNLGADTLAVAGCAVVPRDTLRIDSILIQSTNLLVWDFETPTKYNELRGLLYDPLLSPSAGRMVSSVDSVYGGSSRLIPGDFDQNPANAFEYDSDIQSHVLHVKCNVGGLFTLGSKLVNGYCSIGFMFGEGSIDLSTLDSISFDVKGTGKIRLEFISGDTIGFWDTANTRNGNYFSDSIPLYFGEPWRHISIPVSELTTDTLSALWIQGIAWATFSRSVMTLVLHALENSELFIDNVRLHGPRISDL